MHLDSVESAGGRLGAVLSAPGRDSCPSAATVRGWSPPPRRRVAVLTDPRCFDFPGDVSRSGDLSGSRDETRSGHVTFAPLTPARGRDRARRLRPRVEVDPRGARPHRPHGAYDAMVLLRRPVARSTVAAVLSSARPHPRPDRRPDPCVDRLPHTCHLGQAPARALESCASDRSAMPVTRSRTPSPRPFRASTTPPATSPRAGGGRTGADRGRRLAARLARRSSVGTRRPRPRRLGDAPPDPADVDHRPDHDRTGHARRHVDPGRTGGAGQSTAPRSAAGAGPGRAPSGSPPSTPRGGRTRPRTGRVAALRRRPARLSRAHARVRPVRTPRDLGAAATSSVSERARRDRPATGHRTATVSFHRCGTREGCSDRPLPSAGPPVRTRVTGGRCAGGGRDRRGAGA